MLSSAGIITLKLVNISPRPSDIPELRNRRGRFKQGRNQIFISGVAIFMKFHLMTSSCLFNRGITFSQTVTYNSNVFLLADTNSIVHIRTFCTKLEQTKQNVLQKPTKQNVCFKSRQNRTFCNSIGGWITGVKRNLWFHPICACTEQHFTYELRWENWWLRLRVWCLGKCVGLGFMLQLEKEKKLKTKSNIFHWFYLFPNCS